MNSSKWIVPFYSNKENRNLEPMVYADSYSDAINKVSKRSDCEHIYRDKVHLSSGNISYR